jgi:hypothetical protein
VVFDQVVEAIAEGLQAETTRGEGTVRSFDVTRGSSEGIFHSLPLAPVSSPDLAVENELFGRAAELNWLDEVWEKGTVRAVFLTGPAGIGKTALVNTWREGIKKRNPRTRRTIRVLDDLETLPRPGELDGPGFWILISRSPLPKVEGLEEGLIARRELGPLPPAAGRALLRVAGVRGTDAELEQISRELGGVPADLARRARR